MSANTFARIRNLNRFVTVRAGAGLGLVLILIFIDPASADDAVYGYAVDMGGTGIDLAYGIAVDSSDNVYTTGRFQGTADFDPGPGIFNLSSAGVWDIFVSKLDSAGNFVWAKSMGGTDFAEGRGIAVDASGNVYTTGHFHATVDFDPGPGTFNLTWGIFVQKLDSAGNFVWAKDLGGTSFDEGYGIAVDASDNVYITGIFAGTADFDPGPGIFNLSSAGLNDVFISKLDSAGDFVWAKAMGDASDDWGYGIAVDASGNVYSTGFFAETADFDPGQGIANLSSAGGQDIFVSKLDSSGEFVWAQAMGGNSLDTGRGIALDASGNVYTIGSFEGTADFDPGEGAASLGSAGGSDIFLSKLDSAGNFVWAKAMGGTGDDRGLGIALDATGSVHTTGRFQGTADFDPGTGTASLTSAGGTNGDIFVSKLDSTGNFVWAKAMGGTSDDWGLGIVLDATGNVYTTGRFQSTANFDPGAGTASLASAGSFDIFVSKLARTGYLVESWVNFGFVGTEIGSVDNPFDTLAEGLFAVVEPGTVKIKGNSGDSVSNETMTIGQEVTIRAVNGTVRIGDLGGRNSGDGRRSGFVSHY